jgi:hypothetical protein
METGIYIRVDSKNMDIGNCKMDMGKLVDWILGLTVEGQVRLIMTLLSRREDFEDWKQAECLKQAK